MKLTSKLLVCVSALFLSIGNTHANIQMDGLTFNSGTPSLGQVFFNTVNGATVDNTVQAQFFFGTTAGSLTEASPIFTFATANQGFLNAGFFTVTSSSVFGGNSGFYKMVAWQGGGSYGVGNTLNGESAVTAVSFGGPNQANSQNFPVQAVNLHNAFAITAVAVPEPTVIALGAIGSIALLLRRRKQ
jgi:hypothetical protein